MNRLVRILSFVGFFFILSAIVLIWTGHFFPNDSQMLEIYSCILLLAFSILFIEHYFSKPTDVLATSISVLLLITPIRSDFSSIAFWFWLFFGYTSFCGLISLISILSFNPKRHDGKVARLSALLKTMSVSIGKTKYQYFLLLILSLLAFIRSNFDLFIILFIFCAFIMVEPWKVFERIVEHSKKNSLIGIGEIFGIQAKRTFLVKMFESRPAAKLFDLVVFKYSMDGRTYKGIIVDNYMLNQEQWVKVLFDPTIAEMTSSIVQEKELEGNVVYPYQDETVRSKLANLVGIIYEESNIQKIRFVYNSRIDIQEGRLLYSHINKKKIYYQVVQAETEMQQLEKKNETGEVIGEAVQLGEWNSDKSSFCIYGWVPNINTPVFVTDETIDITPNADEVKVGNIPNTGIPIYLNKRIALSHHLAILGVTGTGKSVLARYLMKSFLSDADVKVICIDFTEEYKKKVPDTTFQFMIDHDTEEECFDRINSVESIISAPYGKENDQTKKLRIDVEALLSKSIEAFLRSDVKIGIFELPEISNSSGILEYTKAFFKMLFQAAKKNGSFGKRVSIVLEEAHTIVPEFNFMGIEDKRSNSLVNSVSQIALQGRKYNIGFIIIAQRTANVSKTVLTQCNSIIAFQQFDKTSNEFLSNYFGQDISKILPTLQQRQAISFGKAFRSNVPIVFQVPELSD
jgi:hypothetical protein